MFARFERLNVKSHGELPTENVVCWLPWKSITKTRLLVRTIFLRRRWLLTADINFIKLANQQSANNVVITLSSCASLQLCTFVQDDFFSDKKLVRIPPWQRDGCSYLRAFFKLITYFSQRVRLPKLTRICSAWWYIYLSKGVTQFAQMPKKKAYE